MAKNSLFAVLLRSPWWVSLALACVLALLAAALLPEAYRVVGALSGLPLIVIAAIAAWRQWQLPSAAQVEHTLTTVSAMTWPQFASLLENAFARDGFSVQRGSGEAVDFELQRQGRVMLVSARRWKSARIGLEALRALQQAREKANAADALLISLNALTDQARPFAAQHRIAVWQARELAQSVGGDVGKAPKKR